MTEGTFLTAQFFNRAAEALLGTRWKGPLAKATGKHNRLVRFYAKSARPIPIEVWAWISKRAREQAETFTRIADAIDLAMPCLAMEADTPPNDDERNLLAS